MTKKLKKNKKTAIISLEDKTMTKELEIHIEKQEKEVEEKINQQNQSLTKTEEIEIDEF